jgi:hypothetical protein
LMLSYCDTVYTLRNGQIQDFRREGV